MKHARLLALACFCSLWGANNLTAQTTTPSNDWGGSFNLELSKKITDKLSLGWEGEYRSRNNFRSTDRFENTIDVGYKLFDFLKVGAAYSLINYDSPKNKYSDWEIRHRWSAYMTASYEIARFKFSLREKYQQTYRVGVPATETDSTYNTVTEEWDYYTEERANPKKVLRSRLAVSYNIRKCKFEPYASLELSHLIDAPYDESGLVRVRYTVGTDYKIDKKNVLTLFYRFDDEQGAGDDSEANSNYIGVGFTHKF